MNTTNIYNLLQAGRKIQMEFASDAEAETLRVRIHKVKAAQESHLLGIGMMTDEEVQTFSFTYIGETPFNKKYELKFIPQRQRKQYNVVILDDGT